MSALQDVDGFEDLWGQLLTRGDKAGLLAIITDDARMCHGSGAVEGKLAFVDNLFRRLEFQSIMRSDVLSRQVAPTVVIVAFRQMQHLRARGSANPFKQAQANVTRVWVQNDDRWRVAHYQATRLTTQP